MKHDKKYHADSFLSIRSGKNHAYKKIQQKYPNFKVSISHTTRKPRSNEVNGVDYHFVSNEKFEELISSNMFYEYAKIYKNSYGTSKNSVDESIKKNDIIFDIDWQGTKQLSKHKKLELVKIFLVTKSREEVKKRLIGRNQNSDEEIKQRFNSFLEDVKHWFDYDYILINDNLDQCFKQIEKIIFRSKKSSACLV